MAKEITFLSKTNLPVYQEEHSFHVDSMIAFNYFPFPCRARNQKSYLMIFVSITDPSKCGGKLGAFQFCIKSSSPYDKIGPVMTYYDKSLVRQDF